MFWRFVLAAVRFRKRRLALAFAALAVAATLATALFSIYSDIERKMRGQFRGYGANLVIAPAGQSHTVSLRGVTEAEKLGAVAAPFLYTVGRIQDDSVVLAGVDFRRAAALTGYWRVEGARAASAGECLMGVTAAAHFKLKIGGRADLESGPCVIRGLVATGGPEDAQILLPFEETARVASVAGAASLVQARADGARLEQIRESLARALPDDDVRVLHAVAETEANVVLKVRNSLFLLMALILAITTLCVTNNFSALVLQRSREIGVLKAIGAAEKTIAALFLSESLILGAVSTVAGYFCGLVVAWWIGQRIFPDAAGTVGVNYRVFAPVAGVTLALAALATLVAAARIWRIKPAVILRGE